MCGMAPRAGRRVMSTPDAGTSRSEGKGRVSIEVEDEEGRSLGRVEAVRTNELGVDSTHVVLVAASAALHEEKGGDCPDGIRCDSSRVEHDLVVRVLALAAVFLHRERIAELFGREGARAEWSGLGLVAVPLFVERPPCAFLVLLRHA